MRRDERTPERLANNAIKLASLGPIRRVELYEDCGRGGMEGSTSGDKHAYSHPALAHRTFGERKECRQ